MILTGNSWVRNKTGKGILTEKYINEVIQNIRVDWRDIIFVRRTIQKTERTNIWYLEITDDL